MPPIARSARRSGLALLGMSLVSVLGACSSAPESPTTDPEIARADEPISEVEPVYTIDRITKPNGLIIEDRVQGAGELCLSAQDIVTVHYTASVEGRAPYDSSRDRGEPATFRLADVMQGWREGIPGMRVGGQRTLIVPPALGFGDSVRNNIPAGSTLVFDVELLGVRR